MFSALLQHIQKMLDWKTMSRREKVFSIILVSIAFLGLLFGIWSQVGFGMFFIEEAQQARGFGSFLLTSGKMWPEAKNYLNEELKWLEKDRKILLSMAVFNPFMYYFTERHTDSVEMKIKGQLQRVEKELGAVVTVQGEQAKEVERLRQRIQELENIVEAKVPVPDPPSRDTSLPVNHPIRVSKNLGVQPVMQTFEDKVDPQFCATSSGSCYHLVSCRTLRKDGTLRSGLKYFKSKEEAEAAGLRPCKVCRP